jgi:hypothetical protein
VSVVASQAPTSIARFLLLGLKQRDDVRPGARLFACHDSFEQLIVRHIGSLSIPSELRGDIDMVTGLGVFTSKPATKATKASKGQLDGDDDPFVVDYTVVPETIEILYKTAGVVGSPKSSQVRGQSPPCLLLSSIAL